MYILSLQYLKIAIKDNDRNIFYLISNLRLLFYFMATKL